jgi:hypothetical protein
MDWSDLLRFALNYPLSNVTFDSNPLRLEASDADVFETKLVFSVRPLASLSKEFFFLPRFRTKGSCRVGYLSNVPEILFEPSHS